MKLPLADILGKRFQEMFLLVLDPPACKNALSGLRVHAEEHLNSSPKFLIPELADPFGDFLVVDLFLFDVDIVSELESLQLQGNDPNAEQIRQEVIEGRHPGGKEGVKLLGRRIGFDDFCHFLAILRLRLKTQPRIPQVDPLGIAIDDQTVQGKVLIAALEPLAVLP